MISDLATPRAPSPHPAAPNSSRALLIGAAGIAVVLVGCFVSGVHVAATAWLLGVVYWTAMIIGALMLVLIHHIFDASWSVVIRRQWEHGLAAFKWLALLFLPLLVLSWIARTRSPTARPWAPTSFTPRSPASSTCTR